MNAYDEVHAALTAYGFEVREIEVSDDPLHEHEYLVEVRVEDPDGIGFLGVGTLNGPDDDIHLDMYFVAADGVERTVAA